MPFARLFRSRWAALFWAAGIMWTAVDVANSAPAPQHRGTTSPTAATATGATATDAAGDPVDANDLATLANLIGG